MKKIYNILFLFVAVLFVVSCEEETPEPTGINYVTFEKTDYVTTVNPGGTTTVDIPVYTANVSGSDRSFSVSVDDASSTAADGSYTVPSSVTIPGGSNSGTLSIVLSDVNLGIGINTLVVKFTVAEGLFTSAATTIEYTQACTEVLATLDFIFDIYAEETGWIITDALGGTIAAKPAGSYVRRQAPVTETIALCAGRDYTLVVTDSYGDGMNDGSTLGSYTLTIDGVVKATGGGSFGDSESNEFDTN